MMAFFLALGAVIVGSYWAGMEDRSFRFPIPAAMLQVGGLTVLLVTHFG